MNRDLRILHTADLHLGTPFHYLDVAKQKLMRSEQEKIFFQIINLSEGQEIDFLTIAGDLFDLAEPDKALIKKIYQGFNSIPNTNIIINPGNHDYWHQSGLWQEFSNLSHLYVFEPQIDYFDFPMWNVRFHGKPFLSQSSPESLWLLDDPEIKEKSINILIQHGDLSKNKIRSNYNPMDHYWLDRNGFDLALLGHIHNVNDVIKTDQGIPCVYGGCPMGRGFDETGIKGIYLIDLSDTKFNKTSFLPLSGPQFHKIELNLSSFNYNNQLELQKAILENVDEKTSTTNRNSKFDCCQLKLTGSLKQKINYEMLDQSLANMFFYTELIDQTKQIIDMDSLQEEHSLRGDVTRYAKQLVIRSDMLDNVLDELGLSNLNDEQAKKIVKQAYYFTMQAAEEDLDIYDN